MNLFTYKGSYLDFGGAFSACELGHQKIITNLQEEGKGVIERFQNKYSTHFQGVTKLASSPLSLPFLSLFLFHSTYHLEARISLPSPPYYPTMNNIFLGLKKGSFKSFVSHWSFLDIKIKQRKEKQNKK